MMKILATVFSVLIICNTFAITEQVDGIKEDTSLLANCYPLDGTYNVVSSIDNPNYQLGRLDKEIFAVDHVKHEVSFVDLQQEKDRKLKIILKSGDNKPLLTHIVNYPYMCEGSWIVYMSNLKGSGDGSSVVSTKTETKIKKIDDGSLLVVVKTATVIKKWLFAREEEMVEMQYKFKSK